MDDLNIENKRGQTYESAPIISNNNTTSTENKVKSGRKIYFVYIKMVGSGVLLVVAILKPREVICRCWKTRYLYGSLSAAAEKLSAVYTKSTK